MILNHFSDGIKYTFCPLGRILLYLPPIWPIKNGEGGIRTLDTLLGYTVFPGLLLQPLGHLSKTLTATLSRIYRLYQIQKQIPNGFCFLPMTPRCGKTILLFKLENFDIWFNGLTAAEQG